MVDGKAEDVPDENVHELGPFEVGVLAVDDAVAIEEVTPEQPGDFVLSGTSVDVSEACEVVATPVDDVGPVLEVTWKETAKAVLTPAPVDDFETSEVVATAEDAATDEDVTLEASAGVEVADEAPDGIVTPVGSRVGETIELPGDRTEEADECAGPSGEAHHCRCRSRNQWPKQLYRPCSVHLQKFSRKRRSDRCRN